MSSAVAFALTLSRTASSSNASMKQDKGKQVARAFSYSEDVQSWNLKPSSSGSSPTCDSGYSSAATPCECSDDGHYDSDWVPSTPLSPPPSVERDGYFDAVPSTSTSPSSGSPCTPPCTPNNERVRQRRNSMAIATVPPPYHPSFARLILSQKVAKREEEGHECLPEYSSSIEYEAWLSMKMEQELPGVKAKNRSWSRKHVVLHGTTMQIYKYPVSSHPIYSSASATATNVLLHSFSLREAQVGRATDYVKFPFAVRVRAEGHQMLFKVDDHDACVELIETVRAACAISTDLDEWDLPMFITLPRNGRRDPRAIRAAYAAMGIVAEAEAVVLGRSTRDQAAEEGLSLEGDIY